MKLADEIAYNLVRDCQRSGYEIVIPNFYLGNFEMDVFRRMKTGYIYEYEIKISRSDFFNDFKKFRKRRKVEPHQNYSSYKFFDYEKILKHDELRNGDGQANRFYFVVPEGLVALDEVPKHAGLIYYKSQWKTFKIVKNAPLLHKKKKDDVKFFQELATSLSFRELHHRITAKRLKAQLNN